MLMLSTRLWSNYIEHMILMIQMILLHQLKFGDTHDTQLILNNEAAINITSNQVFQELTKHLKNDSHFVGEKMLFGDIIIDFVNSGDQQAEMLTKFPKSSHIDYICNRHY